MIKAMLALGLLKFLICTHYTCMTIKKAKGKNRLDEGKKGIGVDVPVFKKERYFHCLN